MGAPAIQVSGIGKHYQLGAAQRSGHRGRHDTLGETLFRGWRRRRRQRPANDAAGEPAEFWALHDVSFTVEPGEVMGIVGRNGSGKLTLLKILSRITEPTSGYAEVAGRVGSLLEVGTGFHPQLTGRENIYLNGAILGMTQTEVKRKFDEIVDFSEVERFLDTPVKNYSSGMYTRLAFAVAAHLDTEILIVDEVLAVGDAEFQKKCLGKMQAVADRDGRTVLFVSHNMAALRQLTHRCVLLKKGRVAYVGSTGSAIQDYLGTDGGSTTTAFNVEAAPRKLFAEPKVKLIHLQFGGPAAHFATFEDFSFVASCRARQSAQKLQLRLTIFTTEGVPVGSSSGQDAFCFSPGELREIRITLPAPRLAPGRHHCRVGLGQGNETGAWKDTDAVDDTLNFEVRPASIAGSAALAWKSGWGSVVFPRLQAAAAG